MDAMTIVLIVLLVLGMFWMFSRSSKARKKDMEMQEKITVGTKVMTGSGIRGTITEINTLENSVMLKTGTEENPCYMEFDRRAISYLMADVLKTLPVAAEQNALTPADNADNADNTAEEIPAGERKTIKDKNATLEEVEPPKN